MPLIAILLVLVVYLAEDLASWPLPEAPVSPGWAVALGLTSFLVVLSILATVLTLLERRLRLRGSIRAAVWADRVVAWSLWLLAATHISNISLLHWVQAIRELIGDVVIVDEVLALLPVLLAMVAVWGLHYPIQRRIREASMLRRADVGAPVYPIWNRWQYVLMQVRFQFGLVLPPILCILAWSETVDRLWPWGSAAVPASDLVGQGLVFAGAVAVFLFAPLLVRYLWDTMPLPPSPLRTGLEQMCRTHGIRVRAILVWKTWGGMINGAVMGLLGRFRYILLTDALLDNLRLEQVEAVMAHELGHVRRRHMPWLALSLITLISVTGSAATFFALWAAGLSDSSPPSISRGPAAVLEHEICGATLALGASFNVTRAMAVSNLPPATPPAAAGATAAWAMQSPRGDGATVRPAEEIGDAGPLRSAREVEVAPLDADVEPQPAPVWVEPVIIGMTLAGTLYGLGWCSRRFERQADTFAVQHSSGLTRAGGGDRPVTHESVMAMVSALQLVADLNHIPVKRRSWRHGSIRSRQDYLRSLVGQPCGCLRIDRTVRRMKIATVALLAAAILFQFWLNGA